MKLGGPYTEKERLERRDKVFKLHFEQGYSASKIAQITKVNRNTINHDINFGYSLFAKEWEKGDVNAWLMKQIYRFEIHRIKLLEEREKQQTLKERLLVDKIIFDIDAKITQIYLNLKTKLETINAVIDDETNKILKNSKLDLRVFKPTDLVPTSSEKHDIIKLIVEGKDEFIKQIKDVIDENKKKEIENTAFS